MNHHPRQLRLRLAVGLLLTGLALAASALVHGGVSAQGDPVAIGSLSQPVGATAPVELQALYISVPKLGAWQIDISYSSNILQAVSCAAGNDVCNVAYAPATVRLVGASSAGLSGSVINLAALDFKCLTQGTSPLTLTVEEFADTDGFAIPYSVENGSVQCTAGSAGSVGGVAELTGVSSTALTTKTSSNRARDPLIVGAFAAAVVGVSIWLVSRRRRAG
jgi:hypothetical protein